MAANVAYQAGTYLFSFLGSATLGVLLSILWGLLVLAILVLRLRVVLHTGLMEAALEHAARTAGVGPDGELEFCAQCEMPLQPGAAFCAACGTAVAATTNAVRPKVAAGGAPGRRGDGRAAPSRGRRGATGGATAMQEPGRTSHDGEEQA